MAQYFKEPYPARAAIGVAALPKGAAVEMDAVLVLAARKSVAKPRPKAKPKRRRK
jgi:hypothetical protein